MTTTFSTDSAHYHSLVLGDRITMLNRQLDNLTYGQRIEVLNGLIASYDNAIKLAETMEQQ